MRCGGGVNHRMSLSDAALIKDNHVAAAGSVAAAFAAVRARAPGLPLEVECDTLDQVPRRCRRARTLSCWIISASPDLARRCGWRAARALLEASGGLTLAEPGPSPRRAWITLPWGR